MLMYLYQRLPDKAFIYNEHSVSHKKIKSMATVVHSSESHREERLFIVDSLSRCVWVVNNAIVPRIKHKIEWQQFQSLTDITFLAIDNSSFMLLLTDSMASKLHCVHYYYQKKTSDEEDASDSVTSWCFSRHDVLFLLLT